MSFETFRGRNVGEAVAAVKAAFGSNAVIASTKHVSNGRSGGLSQSFVEVTAAPGIDSRPTPFSRDATRSRTPLTEPAAPRQSATPKLPATPKANDATLEEIRALRSLVLELSTGKPAAAGKAPSRALMMLQRAGIEGELAAELAKNAPRTRGPEAQLRAWLEGRIASMISVIPSPIALPGARVVSCIGPTGAGKTTTLAKLGAIAQNDHGRSVAIVTLDTFRVGAVEQMRRFAELMEVPLHVASDPEQFARVMRSEQAEVILVDTPSRAPSDRGTMGLLAESLGTARDRIVDVLLVVPASIRARDAEALDGVYETCPPTALVVTKLDETTQAGGALHAAVRGPLPIAYVSAGPRVPEDLASADADELAHAILGTTET